ncbi:MAG TPA: hypothetical protein VGS10_06590 [Terracidiphilus sp.]|nr:hypothetical protein [Terracidiphilus sp.]
MLREKRIPEEDEGDVIFASHRRHLFSLCFQDERIVTWHASSEAFQTAEMSVYL